MGIWLDGTHRTAAIDVVAGRDDRRPARLRMDDEENDEPVRPTTEFDSLSGRRLGSQPRRGDGPAMAGR
jgi:hypothetical protein